MSENARGESTDETAHRVTIDSAPLNRFHLKVAAYTTGGYFCDGYILGIVAFALPLLSSQFGLSSLWTGLIAASALIGIFFGSIAFGWVTDRVGRQVMYVADLIAFILLSGMQFFAEGVIVLFILRLLMGAAIGADYAIGSALLAEFIPRKHRGPLLASLNAMWIVGFAASYFVGFMLQDVGPEAWRWMLASSAVPAFIVLLLRLGTPESPRWLVGKGRIEEARQVVRDYIHPNADIEDLMMESNVETNYRQLFERGVRKRTAFAGLFWFCQVLPAFALITFQPEVLRGLGVGGGSLGELVPTFFQLAGAVVGVVIMNMLARRRFVIWSFAVSAVPLIVLGIWPDIPTSALVLFFGLFMLINTAGSNLQGVYPSEIFPTNVRSSGVGLAAAISRIGAAIGTFLFPTSIALVGNSPTMLIAAGVLLLGLLISIFWAPETRTLSLIEASAVSPESGGKETVSSG